MKHLARILSLLILVSATLFIAACDGGDGNEPSEKEKQIDLLVGTWKATAVTLDGDPHPEFTEDIGNSTPFTITIAKSSSETMTYTTSQRPSLSPWNSGGILTFGTSVATQLKRDDNVNLTYSVSGSNLTLTLTDYTGEGYTAGRTKTVEGDWIFTMTK